MGYKMVLNVATSLVATLLLHFDFKVQADEKSTQEIPLGMLALPPEPFKLTISKRTNFNRNTNKTTAQQRATLSRSPAA